VLHAAPRFTSPRAKGAITLNEFLSDIEADILGSGTAYLFSGTRLGLTVPVLRMPGQGKVKWGTKAHEDWAFKATLLRFAWDVRHALLLLVSGQGAGQRRSGWLAVCSTHGLVVYSLSADQIDSLLPCAAVEPLEAPTH
jgi:hypothetical protein